MVEKEGFNVGEITIFGLLTLCLYFGGCHKWACPKITTKKLTKHRLQEHARISTVTCSCFFFGACTLSLSNTRIYIRRRIPVGTEKINLPVDQTRDASNIHR
jgi:hypothetical protein